MSPSTIPALDASTLDPAFEARALNTIRMLAVDAIEAANSGHPGLPMGMAGATSALWTRHMRFSPSNPGWSNRDRFVLSAGHGSMLLYAMLHLTGYDLPLDELKNFRQWGSRTPGHPEYGHTPGVETTTGPLGQGFANGVGLAIAEGWLAARYNRPEFPVVDHYTYGIVSDGDLMEGVAQEAASLAGHLRLGKLIYLYDDNRVTIDGYTDLAFTEDQYKRFEAYGWHVQVVDGMDTDAVSAAIDAAQGDPRPSLIGCKTIIGYGNPQLQGKPKAHSDAFGPAGVEATKRNLEWPQQPTFFVPEDVAAFYRQAVARGAAQEKSDAALFDAYSVAYPELAGELSRSLAGELPAGWEDAIQSFPAPGSQASRNASGAALNDLAQVLPNLIGGSADLAPSNKTIINGSGDVKPGDFSGRNFRFGVREHGMGGILNGMALHGGVIPYGGTFLAFSDYMRPSIRLAALMGIRVIYIFTHDSVGVGEDGPTHQPVEQVAALRAIPNLCVIRPADANETVEAWRQAIRNSDRPTALILTRQNLATVERNSWGVGKASGVRRGGYILWANSAEPKIVLVASGSEVEIVLAAGEALGKEGRKVQVVSLPSWDLFAAQDASYRAQVLPPHLPKVALEAGITMGWERWVGNDPSKGIVIGIDRFGASAPYKRIYQEFGLTAEAVVEAAQKLLTDTRGEGMRGE
ncbi:MAG: transketolase [Caldilineaceae bacterium]|nr:transketolase [Caldilineaceae bacterium]HRJ42017.1 transketolase [Caldilineaceae bacterium]